MPILEYDHNEKIEENNNEKAMVENELNGKNAEFLNFKEKSESKISDLENEIRQSNFKMEILNDRAKNLNDKIIELLKVQNSLKSESLTFKSEIENLEESIKTFENEKIGFKTSSKEANKKVIQITRK